MARRTRLSPEKLCLAIILTTVLASVGYLTQKEKFAEILRFATGYFERQPGIVPADLLRLGIYKEDDFKNEAGIEPPYWGCGDNSCNVSSVWGPCYAPHGRTNWAKEVEKNGRSSSSRFHMTPVTSKSKEDLADFCRPGFLIIGAGKCGTSSLYHYLTDHPRVLPASEKQIHFFKYFTGYGLRWYYNHFPTARSFLASGALLTGEASPGYLPYPDVAVLVQQLMPGPRIIALGRDPLERAFSSYRYNYVTPAMEDMKKGKYRSRNISVDQSDSYYQQFLFSFEDMIRAELANLRECLAPGGEAEFGALEDYGHYAWAKREMDRRKNAGLPPLVDMDSNCYGGKVDATVLREQWADMIAQHPEKILISRTAHLTQAMIGRSLYALPLEWWYAIFRREDIYFMCTEELSDMSGQPVNNVAQFLGLPYYNFSTIVQGGSYNVGFNTGYDEETSWEERQKFDASRSASGQLPADLERELLEFFQPFNERLFALTGRRCDWASNNL